VFCWNNVTRHSEKKDLGALAKVSPDLGDQFALSITGSQFDCPFSV
jgi:hypothetical protein